MPTRQSGERPGERLRPAKEVFGRNLGESEREVSKAVDLAFDRKLLMLASAIATEPRLILMDEPVGGLNAREIDQMMGLVRSLKTRGITVILIEHVMRFLVALSTRVMILHHGEKIYEGSPGGLVRDRTVIDVYLGEGASQRLAAVIGDAAHG